MNSRSSAGRGSIATTHRAGIRRTWARAFVIAALLSSGCVSARADQICGPAEERYAQRLASAMQRFAARMTNTGTFLVTNEYPGTGTIHVITFADRGKTIFVHRLSDGVEASATLRPGKSRAGEPGIGVSIDQGHLGSCEYGVYFHDGKFVVVSRGLKR